MDFKSDVRDEAVFSYRRLPSLPYRGFPNPQTVRPPGASAPLIGKFVIQPVGKPAARPHKMPLRCGYCRRTPKAMRSVRPPILILAHGKDAACTPRRNRIIIPVLPPRTLTSRPDQSTRAPNPPAPPSAVWAAVREGVRARPPAHWCRSVPQPGPPVLQDRRGQDQDRHRPLPVRPDLRDHQVRPARPVPGGLGVWAAWRFSDPIVKWR